MMCFGCRAKYRQAQEILEKEILLKQIAERKVGWLNTCGIQPLFMGKTFKNYKVNKDNKLAYDISLEYAEAFPLIKKAYHSLALISDNMWGVGKTHLACSIANRIVERWMGERCPILFTTEPKLFNRIRATYNHETEHETEEAVFDLLIHIPLLIVDDVGKEEIADPRFVQRIWFQIVNGRYDNMLPMVITANMSPDGVANHLGGSRNNEATFDRLYEMLNGVFYEMMGKSYRRDNG
jgi:DNA replication protein DnaC